MSIEDSRIVTLFNAGPTSASYVPGHTPYAGPTSLDLPGFGHTQLTRVRLVLTAQDSVTPHKYAGPISLNSQDSVTPNAGPINLDSQDSVTPKLRSSDHSSGPGLTLGPYRNHVYITCTRTVHHELGY